METWSDTFYRDFMVKLIRRLSGNLIYSMKTPDDLQSITLHSVSIRFPY